MSTEEKVRVEMILGARGEDGKSMAPGEEYSVSRGFARMICVAGKARYVPTGGSVDPDEEPDVTGELDGIDLTERAGEIAIDHGLTAEDFEGHEPSGATGFTVDDVNEIVAALEAEDE